MTQAACIDDVRGYTAAELAAMGLPELPTTARRVRARALAEGWSHLEQPGAGGVRRIYPLAALPEAARAELLRRERPTEKAIEMASLGSELHARYMSASATARETAARRVQVIRSVRMLVAGGVRPRAAYDHAAAEHGESVRTIHRWDALVRGRPEQDWAPLLLPGYRGDTTLEPVHPEAWNWFLSDYLRPGPPRFAECYRRLVEAAAEKGWAPIPSIWSLQRRYKREVPKATDMIRRQGVKAYEACLPKQRRDKSGLRAMQWINGDGHKLDVFVAWPLQDGTTATVRVVLAAWQDVYSGKIVGWRIDRTENVDAVRMAFADVVRQWGIPEHATVDNGHAFAGKDMTGRALGRHRFPQGDDELPGVYINFGVTPHFALPYSGRSKPIERAFRDLASEIAKHPLCAGAYTGNTPTAKPEDYRSRAIPLDELVAHVERELARHNARTGRTSPVAQGRSFDEVFFTSYNDPSNVIRRATEAQIRWLMLPAEALTVSRLESSITLLGNRYHHPALIELRGEQVAVRYDPADLHAGVWVFKAGELEPVCHAECVAKVGWHDTEAARRDMRARRAQTNAAKEAAAALGTVSPRELTTNAPRDEKGPRKSVIEGKFGRAAQPPASSLPAAAPPAPMPPAPPAARKLTKQQLAELTGDFADEIAADVRELLPRRRAEGE